MIARGDWRRLVSEAGDDLVIWHPEIADFDWPATLAQPHWHLITDGQGSWCLLTPLDGSGHQMEAHLIIAPTSRGRHGLTTAREMLTWIDGLGVQTLTAKVTERKTTLFLRWLGFNQSEESATMTRCAPS